MSTVFKSSSLEYGYHPDFEILLGADRIFDFAFDIFSKNVKENTAEAKVVERHYRVDYGEQESGQQFCMEPVRRHCRSSQKNI